MFCSHDFPVLYPCYFLRSRNARYDYTIANFTSLVKVVLLPELVDTRILGEQPCAHLLESSLLLGSDLFAGFRLAAIAGDLHVAFATNDIHHRDDYWATLRLV